MQRLEVSGAVRPIYGSLGVKRLAVLQNLRKFLPQMCGLLTSLGAYVVFCYGDQRTLMLSANDRCCEQQLKRLERHKIKKSFSL